mgnify:CR=1 FL=1
MSDGEIKQWVYENYTMWDFTELTDVAEMVVEFNKLKENDTI